MGRGTTKFGGGGVKPSASPPCTPPPRFTGSPSPRATRGGRNEWRRRDGCCHAGADGPLGRGYARLFCEPFATPLTLLRVICNSLSRPETSGQSYRGFHDQDFRPDRRPRTFVP